MHSFISIFTYIAILLTMGLLPITLFWLLFVAVFSVAFYLQNQIFLKRLLKLKWLFLSIFLVCAFGTPGEYFSSAAIQYLPTKEGVILGVEQTAKIIIAIASLSVLFYKKDMQSLIQGVYILLLPLKCLKLNVNKIAIRLLLTLNYVNTMTQASSKKMHFSEIYHAMQDLPKNDDINFVNFSIAPFAIVDYVMFGLIFFYLCLIFKFAL